MKKLLTSLYVKHCGKDAEAVGEYRVWSGFAMGPLVFPSSWRQLPLALLVPYSRGCWCREPWATYPPCLSVWPDVWCLHLLAI